ncbi:hypothetical protein EV175_002258 [Coemansia sp. RSA 1933]|nr:hypothetical protein EV175_002258 [Coemansia sp. RSA 1933]
MPSMGAKEAAAATSGRSASSSVGPTHDERRLSASDGLFRRWSTRHKSNTGASAQSSAPNSQRLSVIVRKNTNTVAKPPSSKAEPHASSSDASRHQSKKTERNANGSRKERSSNAHGDETIYVRVDLPDSLDKQARKPKKEGNERSPSTAHPRSKPKDAQPPRFLRFFLGSDNSRSNSKEQKRRHNKQKPSKSSSQRPHAKAPKISSKQAVPSATKSRHKHDNHKGNDKSQHSNKQRTKKASSSSSSSKKASGSKAPLPKGAAVDATKPAIVVTKKPTIRFSEPPVQQPSDPAPVSTGALLPQIPMPQTNRDVVAMPMPEHYTMSLDGDIAVRKELPRIPDRRKSAFGTDPQGGVPGSKGATVLQPLQQHYFVDSNSPNRLSTVSQNSVATTGGKSHVSYLEHAENEEEQQQTVRVYRVLGRRNTNQQELADIHAVDAQSPLLVTIAQDGSIVGETGAKPVVKMPSAFSPTLSLQNQMADTHGSAIAPVTSTGDSTSFGTDSLKTARLFTGKHHFEDRRYHRGGLLATFDMPSKAATTSKPHDPQAREDVDRRGSSPNYSVPQRILARKGSDVSDIAMRTHLSTNVDNDGTPSAARIQADSGIRSSRGDSFHSSADEQMTDQAFSEWLHLHAVTDQTPPQELQRQSQSLSLACAQYSSASSVVAPQQHSHQSVPPPSQQRHFSPSPPHQNPAASSDIQRLAHSSNDSGKSDGLVGQLLTRVSDLETRFMCMEAIMASIEEKLAGLTVTAAPTLSRSLSMKRMTAAFSAGKMPEIRNVDKSH